jgi:predicted GNAT family N-acyltransferase
MQENQSNTEEQTFALKQCQSTEDMDLFKSIQIKVFAEGQGIDREAVLDTSGNCTFFLFYVGEELVGAIRHNKKDEGYKIERVAILEEHRRKGYGQVMLDKIVQICLGLVEGEDKVYSYIQEQTLSFYLKCGFDVDTEHEMTIQNIKHYKAVYKKD